MNIELNEQQVEFLKENLNMQLELFNETSKIVAQQIINKLEE